MRRTDDDTLIAALQVLGQDAPPQPPTDHIAEPAEPSASSTLTPPLLIATAVALVVLIVLAIGVAVGSGADADPAPSSSSPPPETTVPAVAAITVDGELLGSIHGTILDGDIAIAYPGQPVTAPRPRRGEAVAWQWELCDSRCTPIGGATDETQASPPTPSPMNVRVVVQVDLDGAQIRVASAPYRAMPWPENSTTTAVATPTTDEPVPATTASTPTTLAIPSTVAPPSTNANPVPA